MKDGRTHLAHKAEHAVDLETGAVVAVTVQEADTGDTASMVETLIAAAERVESVRPDGLGIEEVVGDKGYHSNQVLADLQALGLRSCISEPDRGPPLCSKGQRAVRDAVYGNRRRSRVRDGPDAAGPSSRASEHFEATARAPRRLQPPAAAAPRDRRRHPAEPPGPGRGPVLRPAEAIGRPLGRFWGFFPLFRPRRPLHGANQSIRSSLRM